MIKQEQSEKIVYGSLITSTKCYNCIHFPLCFAQKGGANLELASENDCCYYQSKLPEDSVVLSRKEYNEIKMYQSYIPEMKKAFDKVRNAAIKETAREILREIRGYYPVDLEHCDKGEAFILELCYELANKYGVEIKE